MRAIPYPDMVGAGLTSGDVALMPIHGQQDETCPGAQHSTRRSA
jgi:hypothetical protein